MQIKIEIANCPLNNLRYSGQALPIAHCQLPIAHCPLNNLRYSGQALPILPFSDKATPKTPFLSGFDIHNKPVYGG